MDDLGQIAIHDLSQIVPRLGVLRLEHSTLIIRIQRLEWIHRNTLKIYSIENSQQY